MDALIQLRGAIIRHKLMQRSSGDNPILDNQRLLEIIDGQHQISQEERQAILNSPATLRRMFALAEGFLSGGKTLSGKRRLAANDSWFASPLQRLAADSGSNEAFALTDETGWWHLSFPQTRDGWLIELEMREDAPLSDMLDDNLATGERQRSVAIVDGTQRTLLLGQLNFNRTLSAPWPLLDSPQEAIARAGGLKVIVI